VVAVSFNQAHVRRGQWQRTSGSERAPHRMSATAVDIGILGLGGFAMFSAQQFAQVPGAVLRCIAGKAT